MTLMCFRMACYVGLCQFSLYSDNGLPADAFIWWSACEFLQLGFCRPLLLYLGISDDVQKGDESNKPV